MIVTFKRIKWRQRSFASMYSQLRGGCCCPNGSLRGGCGGGGEFSRRSNSASKPLVEEDAASVGASFGLESAIFHAAPTTTRMAKIAHTLCYTCLKWVWVVRLSRASTHVGRPLLSIRIRQHRE